MDARTKVPIIYITSLGRSGSTLLDLMLDRHSQLESVGELDFLDHWRAHNLLCSCRAPVRECAYWQDVLARVPGGADGFEIGKISRRDSLLAALRMPSREEAVRYATPSAEVFRAVLAKTGKRMVVDSSKRIPRLYYLYRSGLFDLHVIHLVRNGKAVVNSYRRPVPRAGYGDVDVLPPGSATYTSARWVAYNLKAEQLGRRLGPERYVHLRYEDLAQDPTGELLRICRAFGLDPEAAMAEPSTADIHNICGSRWRFEASGPIVVKKDERWREELRWRDEAIFSVIGGALNSRYGYSR